MRFCNALKRHRVQLHAYASVSAAKAGVGRYLEFYNGRRPHTSLGDRAPAITSCNT
jgi:putative transposase